MNKNQTLPALFDTKFVSSTLKQIRKCPKCQNEYSLKVEYYSNANYRKSGKRPFLLACGHNMCENCIVQNRQNLACMECLRPIEIPSNQHHRDNFEINYYLYGLINKINYHKTPSAQVLEAKKPNLSKCVECEQKTASGICKKCEANFCKKCFDLVHHEDSKFLRTHVLEDLETNVHIISGPRDTICRIHRKPCEHFCLKCQMIICWQCTKTDHVRHGYKALIEENNSYKDELLNFLEVIKETRENMRKSQKEIKSVANYLQECAWEVIQEVNDYFLDLHSFLQLEEQKVLKKFMKCYEEPQRKIHEAIIALNNSQNSLNNIKIQFELYSKKPPSRVHLMDVIKAAANQLEELPCQVEISKILNKPFIFESRKDSKIEIRKLYSSMINEPNFSINLEPVYTGSNRFSNHHCGSISMDSEMYSDNISMSSTHRGRQTTNCRKLQDPQQALMRSLNISCNKYHDDIQYNNSEFPLNYNSNRPATGGAAARQPLFALVSHIKNPEHFYIQLKENIPLIQTISEQFVANSNSLAESVKTISEGNLYMIYHINDSLWYRAIVKKTLKTDTFKVFLQDFGTEIDVPKNSIYEINDETRVFPLIAKRCGIDNIMPVDKLWNEDSRMLMTEIIENKSVQVILHEEISKDNWKVDIYTTHTKEPISVRDSFLYTGLAREKVNRSQLAGQTKTLAKMQQRFKRPHLTMGIMFRPKIVNIENPQEFYAIKMDQYSAKMALCDDLNAMYSSKNTNERLYFAQQQMACAAYISSKWHRACVEEIKGGGEVRIRLVDEGCYETVNWRQLFALDPYFLDAKEYAFECCLADVEPLQKEDYIWTDDAIAYFTQMSKNPTLQMTISSLGQSQPFKVTLHITRKDVDSNIGARLVKYKHAVSTGERSSILDLPVTPTFSSRKSMNKEKSTPAVAAAAASSPTHSNDVPKLTQKKKTLQRTPIKIVHIETPSEFYVQLVDFLPGIKHFHQQIQLAQSQLQDSLAQLVELKEWHIGDHCLVHTTKTSERGGLQQYPEWYRGIISDIDYSADNERPFTIFLRDEGRTIRLIRSGQLAPINDLYDRVSNGSHLCHFACVQPTGGLENWSQTAIDQFKHYVSHFESLSATKQGTQIDGSIPIILWGMQTETNDPLAPSVTRYTNINHLLVVTGLAHLAEKFDLSLQMDAFQQMEPDEGEETLTDWFEKFNKKTSAMSISADAADNQTLKSYSHDFELDSEGINDVVTGGWLPPRNIEKTLFTAYATYVDYEGYIHLHDADLHDFLQKMRTKINNMFGDTVEPDDIDGDFCVGRPCLARYHLDQHYYRATIKSVQADNTFEVRYIDYGNIESCDLNELRMFTPFPKVPAIASKIEIDGIRPKNGESGYSTSVLDKIHSKVVGKMISVRVVDGDVKKLIKKCTIRVDNEDLASNLIACGYVEPANIDTIKVRGKFRNNPIVCLESPPSEACADDENDAIEMEMERKFELVDKLDKDHHKNKTERNKAMANFYEDIVNENDFDNGEDDARNIDVAAVSDDDDDDDELKIKMSPEIRKRMFSPEEYSKMFAQLKHEKIHKSITGCGNRSAINIDDDDDDDDDDDGYEGAKADTWAEIMKEEDYVALNLEEEKEAGAVGGDGCGRIARDKYYDMTDEIDVLELERSFQSNYWQNDNDAACNQQDRIQQKIPMQCENEVDEILSEFDNFIPRDASSSFSNFSGIEQFRSPTFPPGVESFACDVVFIRSSSLIHIFPHLHELHYRELELERSIQLAAKRSPPLHKFNARTMCIARYSKDKLWYRAVIRSYNVAGKQVEVTYVDFLNTETVPIDDVRRCPSNLISMPLRTFVVKLAGMRPNPRIPSKDIKIALKKCIANRKLYGRLMRTQNAISTDSSECRAPAEIIFYESKSSKRSICEDLIANNFYCRM